MGFTSPVKTMGNELGTSTDWNTYVRDNGNFLYGPPRCRVYNTVGLTIATGTTTALTFDAERQDTDTMHSTSSNTGRITFTTAGTYLVGGHVAWAAVAGSDRRVIQVKLNGASVIGADSSASSASQIMHGSVCTQYVFAAADYVELEVRQESGGNLNVTASANFSPEFWANWIGS